jgi:hypothetical protein
MENVSSNRVVVQDDPGTSYLGALSVVTTLFFMWGFLTCLNDILVPHLKSVFQLGYAEGALVQFSFFSAYFLMSLPSGKLVARVGYKRGLLIGLATAGVGALLFYPAASLPSYPFFLAALFVLATGITVLQVTANPYVTVLGPPATASSRLNLTQAFNALGTTVAPYFGGHLILGAVQHADPLAEARAVRLPYIGLALTLFVLAGALALIKLPTISSVEGKDAKHGTFRDALAVPHLRAALHRGDEQRRRRRLRLVLLGRRDGGPVHRIGGAAQVRSGAGPRRVRDRGGAARGGDLAAHRIHRDVDHPRGGPLQLHHVPDHLHAGHRRPRQAHEPGLEHPDHGGRRRRGDARPLRLARRPHRRPPRLHPARALLSLHRPLRLARLAPHAERDGGRARALTALRDGDGGRLAHALADRLLDG